MHFTIEIFSSSLTLPLYNVLKSDTTIFVVYVVFVTLGTDYITTVAHCF